MEPCFGSRVREDGRVGSYEWQTYTQVSARVDSVAAALWHLSLVPRAGDGKRFLGFFLKNCRDWMVCALAAYKTNVVVVPMYDTLGPETVGYIQRQTTMPTVLCTATELKAPQPLLGTLAEPSPADLAYLCYTSGTTGDPKGATLTAQPPAQITSHTGSAMLTHGNLLAAVGMASYPSISVFSYDPGGPQEAHTSPQISAVHISYLPLAHIFETVVMNFCLFRGAAVGFYQGDTLKIVDDLQALRPTIFVSVPRLYNRIHDKIAKGGLAGKLFFKALDAKLQRLHATGSGEHRLYDALIFSKVRRQLGLDRCAKMLCGSAPIAADVKDFLRVAIGAPLIEGYGLRAVHRGLRAYRDLCGGDDLPPRIPTLCGVGVGRRDQLPRWHAAPWCCELKLQDVSEMGYSLAPHRPAERARCVCVRGPCVFGGYYKMEEKTREAFDAAGWFHTGDIGAWTTEGCLRIVDRKKNIFKLAQETTMSEYVAAEKIETVLLRCPLLAQLFVYCDSLQSYLVAVAVPDAEEVAAWAAAAAAPAKVAEVLREPAAAARLHKAISQQIAAMSTEVGLKLPRLKAAGVSLAGLKGFERIKKLHLEGEPWSVDNGMLTPTFKMKRNDLKKRYQAVLDALYADPTAGTASKL
ncbi:long-chain-fatty-acid-CoA ligase [Emiliania huxleyi CCMP1516]|uniref:AMP-dependent synthetase/ligase domain-containing protein n=2 Tax=Emiliania huxleyi TaxID=2903 RepID=A0A0D3I2C1_EMIH1|nr:long-chain-fatty-acid-CoA ligase [Emiliania huxleyi CCMP1516]EOD05406.1 long-chain-fatty-acid-CoA ligase [Emiliania huxleyi CCMP1516]|eukprot:XP_005757835.1 long-chain-fatty-acid-CoA ligase [Emiliania huxleyi CCMP1516]